MDTTSAETGKPSGIRWWPAIAMVFVGDVVGLAVLFVLGYFLQEYDRFRVIDFLAGCVFSVVVGGYLRKYARIGWSWFVVCGLGWVASGVVEELVLSWSGYHIERGFFLAALSTDMIMGLAQYIALRKDIGVLKSVSVNVVVRIIINGLYFLLFGSLISWGSW